MYCPLCKGQKISDTVTFTADLKDIIVVIRDVPATVCSLCGAEWISDEVSKEIEDIVLEAKEKRRIFEVIEYKKLVA